MNQLFQLNEKCPWGVFGSMLISGFLSGKTGPRQDDILRTGPYIPPVSFPSGYCVITDVVKIELAQSNLRGLQFAQARLGKVVELDWQSLDWTANDFETSKVPYSEEIGEPEGLILRPKHRPDLAKAMPKVWFLKGIPTVFRWKFDQNGAKWICWSESGLDAGDVFCIADRLVCVSERGRQWFESRYPEWITFRPRPAVP